MKKISFIIPSFDVGGTESSFIRMANSLSEEQFSTELVYWFQGGDLRKLIKPKVITTKLKVSNLFSLLMQLIKYYDKSKPDIVHTSMYMIGNISLIARIFSAHKPKIIIGARSDFTSICKTSKNLFDELLLRKLSAVLFKKSDQIVAVSSGVRADLIASLNLNPSKVIVIYNGILTKAHRAGNSQLPNHQWYSMENICIITSIGRLSPEKGIYELVCAFKKAVEVNKNLRLIIIGEGEEKQKIDKYINDHCLKDYVQILEFRDDYYSYLDHSDIYVLNSYFEGMPSILVEAVSTNAKIISTDCKHGPNELLEGVEGSQLIEVNNENQLLKAINKFSTSKKIERTGVEHLEEFYIEQSTKKYIEIFNNLIG